MIQTEQYILVFCTCPDAAAARVIAEKLVVESLAACVNVVSGLESLYQWRGKLQTDREVLLIIKTEKSRLDDVEAAILASHSYELPEIIAVPIEAGSESYLNWLSENIISK